jgi:hypothetical protein
MEIASNIYRLAPGKKKQREEIYRKEYRKNEKP